MEENKGFVAFMILAGLMFVMLMGITSGPSLTFGPKKSNFIFKAPKQNTVPKRPISSKTATTTKKVIVKQSPIQLLSPNGGEVWERNKQYNVRWNTDVPASTPVLAVLFPTKKIITDPYAAPVGSIAGVEMFVKSTLGAKTNEGTYSYHVPDTFSPGTYQILIWGGSGCDVTKTQKKCLFDLSDGLFSIK